MEPGAEILSEAMCKAAEEIPGKKAAGFRKVRDTVMLAALAAGAYAANTSGMSWQAKVGVNLLNGAAAVGVLSSYVGKHPRR